MLKCCRKRNDRIRPQKGKEYLSSEPTYRRSGPVKVLILGVSNAGKSTILNQLKFLYGTPPSVEERKMYAWLVHRHIISRMKEYLEHKSSLSIGKRECKFLTMDSGQIDNQMKNMMNNLWAENSPQKYLYHDLKYFINNMDRIIKPGYVPSLQDLCLIRIPTAGVRTVTINLRNRPFDLYDVGGQEGERRKWIHYFDDVHAIIFIVAISDYNETSPNGKNQLAESLEVFSGICENHHLRNANLLLFFNKIDVFERKIAKVGYKSIPGFPRYNGKVEDTQLALKHITYLYLKCNRDEERIIHGHITCGIHQESIKAVFDSCVENIIRGALASMGFV